MRRFTLLIALSLALASCREGFFDPTPGDDGKQATGAELIGVNIRMLEGEANAVRVSFRPKDPSARLRIERSSPNGRIVACGLRQIDDPLPPVEECLPDVPDGVRETITTTGLGAIVLVREGDPITIDFRLSYEEGGRAFSIRIPVIDPPPSAPMCTDNACNPFFELTPTRGGAFTATANFEDGVGTLQLLEGRVLAKAFSSTGIPYRTAAIRSGVSPLTVTSQLNAPSEYALALSNAGTNGVTAVKIDATWP
jgi:hypothetical protein